MPHQMYNVMAPIGRLHAHEVARSVDALCQQACTHAALAGALVARGASPGEAFQTVAAWEGAGMFVPPEVRLGVPTRALGITGIERGITGMPGILGVPGYGVAGISPYAAGGIAGGMWY